MKKTLISAALLSLTSFAALAHNSTQTYDVVRGSAETFSVSQTEQLGKFRAVLMTNRGSWHHRTSRFNRLGLVLDGVIKGVLNPDFTLTHSFVNNNRTGVLYTEHDSITTIFAGDPTCQNGTGSTPFEVEEILNIVGGTGIYADVEAGSFMVLRGVINNCPSLPAYGQNTFEIIDGSVTFAQ
ncbi:hypothetical protein [Pseudocolwellia agarivorans]|jgi:hypothetical protein|uniref:hypothetical protein n=1 Tax=Pseudocolwellia agarivorans TaxID=1911682 RepID=UPI003F880BAF